jgi:two-component system, response regulator FlrC
MRLLIIGDLSGQISVAYQIAASRGVKVQYSNSIDEALIKIRDGDGGDLIFIDVKQDIKSLKQALDLENFNIPIIACSTAHNIDDAVNAIKDGAKEFLPLPPNEELIAAIFEIIATDSSEVVYKSNAMQKVINLANQVAPSDASILITGQSGTGKEVMARYLYQNSKRKSGPFIAVNCAAIPDNLLESELFGHEKGAFTGAVAKRVGKFEEANNGTILLDEISEIDIKLQAKLLRVLQEREVERIGGAKPVKLNIRIIATSNRNLKSEVAAGTFREDLYFRLNVINIDLPPLCERKEDIILIAEHYIKKYSEANGINIKPLSSDAITLIQNYKWPGNVRELENTIYRAVLLANDSEIIPENLMLEENQEESLLNKKMANAEYDIISSTLADCLGNKLKAATILGITIKQLQQKLDDLKIC